MSAKLTTSEFIERARQVHGDRYDYSKSVYVNSYTKVIINCPEHGDFEQRPAGHLNHRGCPSCGRLATTAAQTLTTETFVAKAREVHGDRYDYSNTEYFRSDVKLVVTCKTHGDYEVYSHNHLRGVHCPMCSGKGKRNTDLFIKNAENIHGNRYDYSEVVYQDAKSKVVIICREHGRFNQAPTDHTRGRGCPSCAGNAVLSTEMFIAKARAVHGDRYDYSKSVYVNDRTKVMITCPEHGDFEQTPGSHMIGKGCPSCATGGYDPHKTGYLYFLLDTETHSRIKIGISNDTKQRFQKLRRQTPFEFESMEIIETYGEIAPQLEKLCHEALPSANLSGFDGATEWMKYEGATVRQLIETCESYRLLDTPLRLR